MKTIFFLAILLQNICSTCLAQNTKLNYLDSCKVACDKFIADINDITVSNNKFVYNANESFVKLYFENNVPSRRISYREKDSIAEAFKHEVYTVHYSFIYNFSYNGYSIHTVSLNCSVPFPSDIKKYNSIIKFLKKKILINPEKATEIAKQNGINQILSYDLSKDPKWRKPDLYEENERKWKITWTIKAHHVSNGKKMGYDVIKIDAKNGEVLAKYIEFSTD